VLVSSAKNSRVLTIWPAVHIVVAFKSQVVSDVKDAFTIIRNNYGRNSPSMLSFISGPSRTTDIPTDRPIDQSNVVIGAQGPNEMILFLIDDSKKD
jgi:L-lactate dehydrogenase complex protein LldG